MAVSPFGSWTGCDRLRFVWILVVVVCVCQLGCVRRRMTIRTNPPGAALWVDDYEIGTTPVSTNFTYYGKRKIRLVKDGYETLTLMQAVPPPWYQIPPLDFFSENLVPGELRDQRNFTYQLTPQRVVPPEELLHRAEQLRGGVQAFGGAPSPLPSGTPPMSPPPSGPQLLPTPRGPQPTPAPPGIGGQPVYPLPPSGR